MSGIRCFVLAVKESFSSDREAVCPSARWRSVLRPSVDVRTVRVGMQGQYECGYKDSTIEGTLTSSPDI